MRIFYVENSFQLLSSFDIIKQFSFSNSVIVCSSHQLEDFASSYIPDNITIATQKSFAQFPSDHVSEVFLFKDNGFNAVKILGFWKAKGAKLILVEEGLSMYALKGTYRLSRRNFPKVIYS